MRQPALHFDETGICTAGRLHRLHTAGNELFAYLSAHNHRGKKALADECSILPEFKNFAVHDCWAAHFNFSQSSHSICCAHLIRELNALREDGIIWANRFKRYPFALYGLTDKDKNPLNEEQAQKARLLFDKIYRHARQIEALPVKRQRKGRCKATKGRNPLNRLDKYAGHILAFATHKHVPFTNSQAERDLRPVKTKLKVGRLVQNPTRS